MTPQAARIPVTLAVSLVALALLGDAGARLGERPGPPAIIRLLIWCTLALGITIGIGALVGTAV